MQFIDTITIFNKVGETYHKHILTGVYWYGSQAIEISGKGLVNNDNINVFIPCEKMIDYSESYKEGKFTLRKGDRIVKGIAEDIQSVNELSKYQNVITITSFSVNKVNSCVDNIHIIGK